MSKCYILVSLFLSNEEHEDIPRVDGVKEVGGVIILWVEQYTSCVREEEVSKLRGQTKWHQRRNWGREGGSKHVDIMWPILVSCDIYVYHMIYPNYQHLLYHVTSCTCSIDHVIHTKHYSVIMWHHVASCDTHQSRDGNVMWLIIPVLPCQNYDQNRFRWFLHFPSRPWS